MSQIVKKIQKYVITKDADGDDVVWNLHRDLSMTRNAMPPHWIDATDHPVIDLRSGDYVEHAPGQFAGYEAGRLMAKTWRADGASSLRGRCRDLGCLPG